MNHYAHLSLFFDAHLAGRPFVVDLINNLDFCVVVSGPQSSQLKKTVLLPHTIEPEM